MRAKEAKRLLTDDQGEGSIQKSFIELFFFLFLSGGGGGGGGGCFAFVCLFVCIYISDFSASCPVAVCCRTQDKGLLYISNSNFLVRKEGNGVAKELHCNALM